MTGQAILTEVYKVSALYFQSDNVEGQTVRIFIFRSELLTPVVQKDSNKEAMLAIGS